MESEERMKNYHWNECNLSDWFTQHIRNELTRRDYEIVNMDVYVKLCARMDNLGLVYVITLETIKDGVTCYLDAFTTTNGDNEGLKGYPWFVDYFKELEGQALLKFSKSVLKVEGNPERSFVGVKDIKAEDKKTAVFKESYLLNCSMEEFIDFFYSDLIRVWTNVIEVVDDVYVCPYFSLKDVEVGSNMIYFQFKINEWENFTDVKIEMQSVKGGLKINVVQRDVPIKSSDFMSGLWREKIIHAICRSFGFVEKGRGNN